MKKTIILAILAAIAVFSIISCEEDEIVSKKHVYTEAELAYIDSVEAEKWRIKADYVQHINIEIPTDSVNYRGVEYVVDSTFVLEKLGLSSKSEFAAAMGTVDGDAQIDNVITFFAIDISTNYDNKGALTANGYGHWFLKNGDVGDYGVDAAVYSEFYPEQMEFVIGQYPAHMNPGDTIKIIQALEAEEYRYAFVFHITFGDYYVEVVPEAEIVATNNLTLEVIPDNSYAAMDLTFDFAAAATAIGVSETELSDNAVIYGINADGSKTSSYTADAGYWYNKDGNVCGWGDDGCVLFVNYEDGTFHIGQFPDAAVVGESYTVSLGIMYNDLKMVVYNITVTVKGYEDPETPPTGDPYTIDTTYTITQSYADDWSANSRIDVKELLRDVCKMTTYQIHTAIDNDEIVFAGLNADGSVYTDENQDTVSTATYPGHWYDASGNVTTYGGDPSPVVYSQIEHSNESLELSIGHHPENASVGTEITYKQIFELNGGKITFTFNVSIVE